MVNTATGDPLRRQQVHLWQTPRDETLLGILTFSTMTQHAKTYRFVIDRLDLDTLPMARLAAYLADLAKLMGEAKHVHFGGAGDGSIVLMQKVDADAVRTVEQRLRAAGNADAPEDVARAVKALNGRLSQDGASARIQAAGGPDIARFRGAEEEGVATIGPFWEQGTLDGVVILVGGKGDEVPVHLLDGAKSHVCRADRRMAQRLAKRLFNGTLRVSGRGQWQREQQTWRLLRFEISDFQVLDDAPLDDVMGRLHAVKSSGWKNVADPAEELRRLRNGIFQTE